MRPLMPKSTAVWLIDNTALTFEQISEFCGLHMLEVQAIADDSVGSISPFDPVANNQLSKEEISRCENDSTARLRILQSTADQLQEQHDKAMAKTIRQERPNGVLWLVKQHPQVTDIVISKLLHTTKSTVEAIRNKSYKNYNALKPQNPVVLGLCEQADLDAILEDRT